ncbi:MAG: PAS domain S-box protein [Dongiaceae bacterium]
MSESADGPRRRFVAGDMLGALAELARRTAMLDAIGYAATQIVAAGDWRAGIQELLDRLGTATGVSRVTLFELHPGPQGRLVESCRYDWAEPRLARLAGDPRYRNMPMQAEDGTLDDWTQRRQRGEVIQARLKDLTGYDRQIFLEHGTLSFVSVPIMLPGGCWGFLGFDECRIEREWSALEIDVLKTAAALVAGAIERAASGERLRLSEERYALAARGANDGLWDWDVRADRAYVSPRLHEILGVAEGSLAPGIAGLLARFDPEDAVEVRAYLDRRFRLRRSKFRFECRLVDDGTRPRRWVVARGMIVLDEGGAARVVGSLRDITDFKQASAELRDSEVRVRAILETAFDAIVSLDEAGTVVELNAAATRIFGYAPEALLGRPIGRTLLGEPLGEALPEGLHAYLARRDPRVLGRSVEVEGRRADGTPLPVELSVTEVPLPAGRLFTAILRDLSERKRFEQRLAEAEKQRASLARYFSPNMVDEMMRAGGGIGAARTLPATVLFADIIGFTAMSAGMTGPEVIAFLREFHGIVEEAVFASEGTLDKYMGDGVMAIFGTPRPGPRDASNAVACARALIAAFNQWNRRRAAAGQPPTHLGVGLHFGEVILGDIGSRRRLELTVVGDTVNVASRVEAMSRTLQSAVVATGAVVDAVRREGGEGVLAGFRALGSHMLRGRREPLALWGITAEQVAEPGAPQQGCAGSPALAPGAALS